MQARNKILKLRLSEEEKQFLQMLAHRTGHKGNVSALVRERLIGSAVNLPGRPRRDQAQICFLEALALCIRRVDGIVTSARNSAHAGSPLDVNKVAATLTSLHEDLKPLVGPSSEMSPVFGPTDPAANNCSGGTKK